MKAELATFGSNPMNANERGKIFNIDNCLLGILKLLLKELRKFSLERQNKIMDNLKIWEMVYECLVKIAIFQQLSHKSTY